MISSAVLAAIERTVGLNLGHRIGEATLAVHGPDGRPLPETVVTVEQRRHAFPFGNIGFDLVGISDPDDLDRRAGPLLNLFNAVTVTFYWGRYEPRPGTTDARRIAATARWLVDRGVAVKGHPLVWHTVQPALLLDLHLDEVERLQ